jgi:hypothetical protein
MADGVVVVVGGSKYFSGPVGMMTAPVAGVPLLLKAGTGTAAVQPSGVLHAWTGSVGNTADTNRDTLWSWTLPANTLTVGHTLKITAILFFANNANAKYHHTYFGSAVPQDNGGGSYANTGTVVETYIVAVDSTHQETFGSSRNSVTVKYLATTETLTGDILLKVTGQSSPAGVANDIVCKAVVVELL